MRRKERIRPFLDILERIWSNSPEYRFGQLLSLAFHLRSGNIYDGSLWHVEDDDFLERLMESMGSTEGLDHLNKIQEPIRGDIMDLNIFEGQDWRLETEDG